MLTRETRITQDRHAYDSARDAIDAVSAFEATTLDDCEYQIETNGELWFARVNNITTRERGYLAVSA
jgi:hypothetical protein